MTVYTTWHLLKSEKILVHLMNFNSLYFLQSIALVPKHYMVFDPLVFFMNVWSWIDCINESQQHNISLPVKSVSTSPFSIRCEWRSCSSTHRILNCNWSQTYRLNNHFLILPAIPKPSMTIPWQDKTKASKWNNRQKYHSNRQSYRFRMFSQQKSNGEIIGSTSL